MLEFVFFNIMYWKKYAAAHKRLNIIKIQQYRISFLK